MPVGLQDVVVGVVAVAAAALVAWRLIGVVRARGAPKCTGCDGGCASAARPHTGARGGTQPLPVVRSPQR